MKRLRLLKPWRLRAVRQRLNGGRECTSVFDERKMPSAAPSSDEALKIIRANCFTTSRIYYNIDGRSENRQYAPASNVIFATVNKRNNQ